MCLGPLPARPPAVAVLLLIFAKSSLGEAPDRRLIKLEQVESNAAVWAHALDRVGLIDDFSLGLLGRSAFVFGFAGAPHI